MESVLPSDTFIRRLVRRDPLKFIGKQQSTGNVLFLRTHLFVVPCAETHQIKANRQKKNGRMCGIGSSFGHIYSSSRAHSFVKPTGKATEYLGTKSFLRHIYSSSRAQRSVKLTDKTAECAKSVLSSDTFIRRLVRGEPSDRPVEQ